ncbi:MAG: hypothetical protein COT00_00170 [Candidatus Omnitrophica bacterium CG07_land_8_20_14_0_80_50_8]|nr:MAG: hypothetical protein COT00_00170 [Candidatus Omnitrophica bacterium CG07_land_8_20_14_0_80_50_8]
MQKEEKNPGFDEAALLKAKSDALRLLSFSARSSAELRLRLKLKKYPDALVDEVIASFKRQGLVDDVKFAKLFAESRIYSRPTGKRQLETDLKRKGLSEALIRQTVSHLTDYDEKAIVRGLVQKKLAAMKGVSKEKMKMRLYGFLKRRGFESDTIFSVMNEAFSGMPKEGPCED